MPAMFHTVLSSDDIKMYETSSSPSRDKKVALNPRNQIVPVSNLICKKSLRIENSNIERY